MDLPSRMMVMASETCSISLSLWEIMMQEIPLARRPVSSSSRCWESDSLSAAVGSSRISSLTDLLRALAISTSCCLPTPMSLTFVVGSSCSPTRAISSRALVLTRAQSITPKRVGSLPRKMFSAMDSSGISASSWWMITMPAASLERMSLNSTGRSSKTMSPE